MATNISSQTCPPNTELPVLSTLPIPQNINVVATPGNDTSYPPMQACCEPNLVQIVDRCYLWCEIPKRYLNYTDKDTTAVVVSACLRRNRVNETDFRIIGYGFNAAARPGMASAKQLGLWVLALSGLVYVL
jgi:hypothetical protein